MLNKYAYDDTTAQTTSSSDQLVIAPAQVAAVRLPVRHLDPSVHTVPGAAAAQWLLTKHCASHGACSSVGMRAHVCVLLLGLYLATYDVRLEKQD